MRAILTPTMSSSKRIDRSFSQVDLTKSATEKAPKKHRRVEKDSFSSKKKRTPREEGEESTDSSELAERVVAIEVCALFWLVSSPPDGRGKKEATAHTSQPGTSQQGASQQPAPSPSPPCGQSTPVPRARGGEPKGKEDEDDVPATKKKSIPVVDVDEEVAMAMDNAEKVADMDDDLFWTQLKTGDKALTERAEKARASVGTYELAISLLTCMLTWPEPMTAWFHDLVRAMTLHPYHSWESSKVLRTSFTYIILMHEEYNPHMGEDNLPTDLAKLMLTQCSMHIKTLLEKEEKDRRL